MLNDFHLVFELRDAYLRGWKDGTFKEPLVDELRRLGDEVAAHFAHVLPMALENHRRVVVLTHVPPFREATWHRGEISNDDWMPYFSCKAAGDVLRETMIARPDREMLVLCGHTHGGGEVKILDNLEVITGAVRYGRPSIQGAFDF